MLLCEQVPVRTVKFQRLFAQYAKGTYPLVQFACDITVEKCEKRLQTLFNNTTFHLPKSEIAKVQPLTNQDILCCSDREIHKFTCNDTATRDKWVKRINKLVDKRFETADNDKQWHRLRGGGQGRAQRTAIIGY